MKKALLSLLAVTLFLCSANAQSPHAVTFTNASGDFNTAEKYTAQGTGQNTDYYITYDATYLYVGGFRTGGSTFGSADAMVVYIDTDPQSTPTSGSGTTTGYSYQGVTGTLPFAADYTAHVEQSYAELRAYSGSWGSPSTPTTSTTTTVRELKIPWSSLGNPKAINLTLWMNYSTGIFANAPGTNVAASANPTITGYLGTFGVLNGTQGGVTIPNIANDPAIGYLNATSGTIAAGKYANIDIAGATGLAGNVVLAPGCVVNINSTGFNLSANKFLNTGITNNRTSTQINVNAKATISANAAGALSVGTLNVVTDSLIITSAVNTAGADTITNLVIKNTGIVRNSANIATSYVIANLNVNSGGTYIHDVTTGSGTSGSSTDFPGTSSRVFGSTSNVTLTKWGVASQAGPALPTITSPGWGNLTVNIGTAWSGSLNMVSNLTAIQGNFNVQATGGQEFRLASSGTYTLNIGGNMTVGGGILVTSSSNTVHTINITGSLSVSGGNLTCGSSSLVTFNVGSGLTVNGGIFTMQSSSSHLFRMNVTGDISISSGSLTGTSSGIDTVTCTGNFNLSGTGLYQMEASSSGTKFYILNIGGNFNMTGGTFTGGSSSSNATVTFTGGSSAVTYTQSGGTITASKPTDWVIAAGKTVTLNNDMPIQTTGTLTVTGTLNCVTNNVTGAGAFTLGSAGTLKIGSTAGISSTASTGSIQVTGTRTYPTTANYEYNGAANQATGNQLPATVNKLTIANTGTGGSNVVTMSRTGSTTLSAASPSLVLTSGALKLTNSTDSIKIADAGGISASSGDFSSASSGNVSFLGTGTVSGTVNFYPTVTQTPSAVKGVDYGTGSTIQTSLTLNNQSFVQTNPPTYATNSTLYYNTGNSFTAASEWTGNATSGSGVPYNVTLGNGTASSSLNFGSSTAYRQLNGSLTLSSTSTLALSTASGGDIKIGKNYTNNGGTLTNNTRAVFFVGATGDQTVTKSGGETFDYVIINKATWGRVVLANTATINQTLTLTNGKLDIGNNNLTFGSSGTTASASTSSYIATTGTGRVIKAHTGSFDYPIGPDTTFYAPLTINNTGTSQTDTVAVANTSYSPSNDGVKWQWYIGESSTSSCNLSFKWFTADANTNLNAAPGSGVTFNYNGSSWTNKGGSTSGTSPNTTTVNSITSFTNKLWTVALVPTTAPTVTTTAATSITSTTASTGGTVTSDGNSTVTRRGLVYSTGSITDTTSTSGGGKIIDASGGTGSYTASLTGLTPGTTYHIRAFALNAIGTSYGSDLTFTTLTTPTVTTTAASSITSTTASSGGTVTADGGATVTRRGLVYSTGSITDTTSTTGGGLVINGSTGTGSFTTPLTGLTPGTTYHIRAFALNSVGVSYGSDLTFTTLNIPTVTTTAASSITSTTASSGGNVTADGGATVTRRGLVYSTGSITDTTSITGGGLLINGSTGTGSFTSSLTGLTPGTTYHIRAFALNSAGVAYGSDLSFTTDSVAPTVTTTAASSVTQNAASTGGNVTNAGGGTVTERGVVYSTSANPTTSDTKVIDGSGGTGSYTSSLTGLSQGTTYHVRAYAINGVGTSYGSDISFTTLDVPAVTTTAATSITTSAASSGGNVTSNGGTTITARGLVYSTGSITDTSSQTGGGIIYDGAPGTGTFTTSLTGLTTNTTYHTRAFAVNSVGISYGGDSSFTTNSSAVAPTVTTTSASSITSTSASSGGNVTSDGGDAVTERGIVYSTSANPTYLDTKVIDGSAGTGSFSSSLTGLTPGTTYHIRAYAINSIDTAYGSDVSFTTYDLATVTTTSASSITNTTASSGGNVTADGGATVTRRGLIYSTGSITDTTSTTGGGLVINGATGTGSYTSSLTGLTPATLYHIRAFAVNSVGVSYGSDLTFTTLDLPTVTTTSASSITNTTASSGGNVTADGGATVTRRGLIYSTGSITDTTSTTGGGKLIDGSGGTGSFSSSLTGLTKNTTYYIRAFAVNSVGVAYGSDLSFTTLNPTISTTGTLSAFGNTVTGTSSSSQNYHVSGTELVSNITVTAPTGFEVSGDNTTFGSTVTLSPTSGTVADTIIYVRFSPASANGANSGNVTNAATDATTRNIAVSGNAIAAEPTTNGTITFGTVSSSSIVINLPSIGDGSKRIVVAKAGSAVSGTPTDGTSYSASATFGSGAALGGGFVVLNGTSSGSSVVTVTGLSTSVHYYFSVFEYNEGTGTSQNYLTTGNATGDTTTTAVSNANDYFRSAVSSGNWNSTSSWQSSVDSSNWVAATLIPDSVSKSVVVQSGHAISVTATPAAVDQVIINSGGQLNVNSGVNFRLANGSGTDILVNGVIKHIGFISFATSAAMNIGATGVYENAIAATSGNDTIPTATWTTGSTCKITGLVGQAATDYNGLRGVNQNFSNFVIDMPNMIGKLVLTNNGSNTFGSKLAVGGDFTIANTGSGTGMQFLKSGTQDTLTIGGNLIMTGGNAFGVQATSSANTRTMNIGGGINLSGSSKLDLMNSTGGTSTCNITWKVTGDITVGSSATLTRTSSGTNTSVATLTFVGANQTFSNSGSGLFAVQPGLTNIATTGGSGTVTFNSNDSVNNLTIDGGNLTLSSGKSLYVKTSNTIASGKTFQVDGTVNNSTTTAWTVTGTMSVSNGGKYQHNINAGTIPTATWNSGSTCEITGNTGSSISAGLNQSFHHFTWNPAAMGASSVNLSGALTTVNGDFTVAASGTAALRLTGATALTMNIGGNLVVSGPATPKLELCNGAGAPTINVTGNVTIGANGTFQTGNPATLKVAGNWSNSGTFTGTNIGVEFNGSAAQTYTRTGTGSFSNLTINNTSGNVTLNNSATVTGTLAFTSGKVITGSNKITLGVAGTAGSLTGAGTGKYVYGNLEKFIPNAAAPSATFEVGDASVYAPALVAFAGTTTGSGSITASTTSGDHPQIATSGILPNKSVNRYWTLTNSSVGGFTSYSPTFTFVAGDKDAGTDTAKFVVRKYNGTSWIATTNGTRTSTTTQASGITSFSDFQVGELCVTPVISVDPLSTQTICQDSAVTNLSVTAAGDSLTYQWYSNTSNANSGGSSVGSSNGGQTASYTPSSATAGTKYYYVVVNGYCGADTSNTAAVIVNATTNITAQPTSTQTVCRNTTPANLSVTATGAGLTYQWYSSTSNSISGGSSVGSGSGGATATYTPSTATAGTMYYYAIVNGTCVKDTSDIAAVIVNPTSTGDTTVTACNSFSWYGTSYTSTASPTHVFTNQYGCDSVVTLHLTVNYSTYGSDTRTECDAYTWHGTTYTTSGNYTYGYTNGSGCSSVDTLHLTVNYSSSSSTSYTACFDQMPYSWNGLTFTTAGTQTAHITNAAGCDSAATLTLSVDNGVDYANLQYPASATICEEGSFTAYGQVYEAGLTNPAGQGAGITVEFGYNSSNTDPSGWTSWSSASYNSSCGGCGNNDEYMKVVSGLSAGTYYYTFRYKLGSCGWQYGGYSSGGGGFWDGSTNISGVLTVNAQTHNIEYDTACTSFTWHGTSHTSSGTYTYGYSNGNGCASVDTLHLIINTSTTGDTTATACNSFAWYDGSHTSSGDFTHTFVGGNAHGCDSTVTLHLTINTSSTGDTSAVACNSFSWYDGSHTSSGDFTHTFVGGNAHGCDSTVTLHLTINTSSTGDTTATACNSFSWYDGSHTSSGEFTHTFVGGNAHGCDSTVTLHLTINTSTTGDTSAVACNSFSWYDGSHTSSGDFTHTFVGGNAHGCDSTVTLHLTINTSNTGDTTATACNSFSWYDGSHTSSGEFTHTFVGGNAHGCDSTVTLHLTINTSNTGDTTATACNSFTWYDGSHSSSGDFTHTFVGGNAHGCDSTVTLHLTINTSSTGDTSAVACNSFAWYDGSHTSSGDFTHTFVGGNAHGCDSTVTLHLTINTSSTGDTTATACNSFSWYDGSHTSSGDFTHTFVGGNAHGCDSTVTLHLTINTSSTGDTSAVACNSFSWYDGSHTSSGDFTHTFVGGNAHGCDSTVTLHLTINTSTTGDTSAVACNSFSWYDGSHTSSGDFTHTFVGGNAHGCDSTVTLHLTINTSSTGDTSAVACNSFSWYDGSHTSSGDFTHTFVGGNAHGCDSTVTLHLTINASNTGDTSAVACNSFAWYDGSHTSSGDFTHTFVGGNVYGCDSTVTLHLTIHTNTSGDTTVAVCNSFSWYDGSHTSSGDFTHTFVGGNQYGCDSTVILHLTINASTTGDTTVVVCNSFTWYDGSHTSSGDFTHTFSGENIYGCDSTVTLHLTVNHNTSSSDTVAACANYSWHDSTYTASGTYTFVGTNAAGCDSTETLHLTINPLPTAYSITGGGAYCSNTDGVHVYLSSSQTGVSYQLVIDNTSDVGAPVSGTGSSLDFGLETLAGSYTIEATDSATGCSSTMTGTVTISIKEPTEGDTTAVACNSFTWYDGAHTSSGDFIYTIEGGNAAGCDSTVTLHLTMNTSTTGDTTAVACNSFVWYDGSHTSSGDFTHTFVGGNVYGCDSTVTLHLTINNSSTGDTTAVACSSFTWYDGSHASSGDFTHTFVGGNEFGCDSTVTLHLTIHSSSASSDTVTACGSYSWHDSTYTATGTYTFVGTNDAGCDSTETLVLTINPLPVADTVSGGGGYCAGGSGVHIYLSGSQTGVNYQLVLDGTTDVDAPVAGTGAALDFGLETLAGVYTVEATNTTTGCINTMAGSATITINSVPVVSFSGLDSEYCLTASSAHLLGSPRGGVFSGPGITDTTFIPSDAGVGGPYTITYTYANGSGCIDSASFDVNVIDTRETVTPGPITGTLDVCPYVAVPTTLVYSIHSVPGATSYQWSYPFNVNVLSTTSDTSISVRFLSGFTGGDFSVKAYSQCGLSLDSSIYSVVLNKPYMPQATINGNRFICPYVGHGDTVHYWINSAPYATSYIWQVPSGAHIIAGQGDTSITVTFDSTINIGSLFMYVRAVNNCASSPNSILVLVNSKPGKPVAIFGETNACPHTNDTLTYYINSVATATSYNWTSSTPNLQIVSGTHDTLVRVKVLSGFTSGNLSVSSVANCGNSGALTLNISRLIPLTPGTITGPTDPCLYAGGDSLAAYSIRSVNNASSYVWKIPAGAHIVATGSTTLTTPVADSITTADTLIYVNYSGVTTTGVININVAALSNCSRTTARALTLTRRVPAAPAAVVGPADPCPYVGGDSTATYYIKSVLYATGYKFKVPSGALIVMTGSTPLTTPADSVITSDTSIVVDFSGLVSSGTIAVTAQSLSNCTASAVRSLTLTRKVPATPAVITATLTNVCSIVGTSSTAGYSIRKVANALSYTWKIPSSAVIVASGGVALPSPVSDSLVTADTSITVQYISTPVTGSQINVNAINFCTTSAYRNFTITATIPSAPASIFGLASVCAKVGTSDTVRYTPSVFPSGASSFSWTVSTGLITIVDASGPDSAWVAVTFASGFSTGSISAKSASGCGKSAARTLAISSAPGKPGAITASAPACRSTSVVFSIASVPFATSYVWTAPTNATVVSGQGTTSATISFNGSFTAGIVSVKASNSCNTSVATGLSVTSAGCFAREIPVTTTAAVPSKITTTETSATVSPNPNRGDFTLNIRSTAKADFARIQLMGIYGNVVLEQKLPVNKDGSVIANISAKGILAGIYELRYIIAEDKGSVKVVIVK